jgi:hypothetical protein
VRRRKERRVPCGDVLARGIALILNRLFTNISGKSLMRELCFEPVGQGLPATRTIKDFAKVDKGQQI